MKPPTKATLRRYGLTAELWLAILESQGGVCPVCDRKLEDGVTTNIDHVHVLGWKKMAPKERRRWIRGITCWRCNHKLLTRYMKLNLARGVVKYLEAHEARLGGTIAFKE